MEQCDRVSIDELTIIEKRFVSAMEADQKAPRRIIRSE